MATASAIQVVDDTLRRIADAGLGDVPMNPRPEVTVGPLDRDADGPRLNWFLYRIAPNPAYRNMEPPRTGSHTARGAPPLALTLSYLLTAFPAELTSTGDQAQIAHVALAAAMRKLHEQAIVGPGSGFLPPSPPPLVEPLRITMDDLDVEDLTKLWTAVSKPMRVSVGYAVSLVVVEQQRRHQPGPPVRRRRVLILPSAGPRLRALDPARVGADLPATLYASGLVQQTEFRLAAEDGDPTPAPLEGDWPMTVVTRAPDGVVLRLPRHDLVPGVRRLDAVTQVEGLPAGGDGIALTVVPTIVTPPPSVAAGAAVTLTTAHTAPDTEVFLDATRIAPSAVAATSVTFTVPGAITGTRTLMLRSRRLAGPPVIVVVTP
jgi:hypothetical protein